MPTSCKKISEISNNSVSYENLEVPEAALQASPPAFHHEMLHAPIFSNMNARKKKQNQKQL